MHVLCVGDSIIAGYHSVWGEGRSNDETDIVFYPLTVPLRAYLQPEQSYAEWRQTHHTVEYSGWSLRRMSSSILTLSIVHKPMHLVLSAGLNDILIDSSPVTEVIGSFQDLLTALQRYVTHSITVILPPRGQLQEYIREGFVWQQAQEQVDNLRLHLKRICNDTSLHKCYFVDAEGLPLDDCIHLNREGMKNLANLVAAIVQDTQTPS